MSNATPEVKPQVANLTDILKWVREGSLRVPVYQRPFRWDRSRVRDLFDSIRKHYPIGAILIWLTTGPRPSRKSMGPLLLPKGPDSPMLLIDGQQRVSAIAGVLLKEKMEAIPEDEDPGMWDLWFDADDAGFKHLGAEPPPPSCIRVRDLLDLKTIVRQVARLSAQGSPLTPAQADKIADSWQNAATALNSYRLPYVEFKTDDLTLAVDSFTRLNRRGLDITTDEMFSALTGDAGQEERLSDHIDKALHSIRAAGLGDLDRLAVLRYILLELGLDPFRTDWNRLGEERQTNTKKALHEVARRAERDLRKALEFLRDDLSLVTLKLLPYSGIVVGVATFLHARGDALTSADRTRLSRWCWHAAFVGFAEGNPSRATQAWKALRLAGENLEDGDELPRVTDGAKATHFPKRFDLRSARLLSFLWAQIHGWALDSDQRAELGSFLNRYWVDAFRRICRPHSAASAELRGLLSSPANRVLDLWGFDRGSPRAGPAIRDLRESTAESGSEKLMRLNVTKSALDALNRGEVQEFLTHRMNRMISDEAALLRRLGVEPPDSSVPQPAPIDHEFPEADFDDVDARLEELLRASDAREAAEAEALGDEPSAEQIIAWFRSFYKNPANGVPYDSGEGGYQYIYGGPWDPEEVLTDTFPDLDPEVQQAALRAICSEGWEWVKSCLY